MSDTMCGPSWVAREAIAEACPYRQDMWQTCELGRADTGAFNGYDGAEGTIHVSVLNTIHVPGMFHA